MVVDGQAFHCEGEEDMETAWVGFPCSGPSMRIPSNRVRLRRRLASRLRCFFFFWERGRFVLLGVEGNSPFVCCPTERPHGSRPRHSGNTQGPAGVLWDGPGNRVFQGTDLRGGSNSNNRERSFF